MNQDFSRFMQNFLTTRPISNPLADNSSPTLHFINQQQESPEGMRIAQLIWQPETNQILFHLAVEPSFLFAFLPKSEQIAAEPPSLQPQNAVKPHPTTCQPANIEKDVEKALKDYHCVSRLARNRLTEILDLHSYQDDLDHTNRNNGLALRHALDQTIDTVTGPDKPKMECSHRHLWQPEHYLHLRYRERQSHKELAAWMGYTERHLHRKRKELIRDAARLLSQQAKSKDYKSNN